MGLLKVMPRVSGKIFESEKGNRFILIEQGGKDIWRGRNKSVDLAIQEGVAGIVVNRLLLQRAQSHNVRLVVVVMADIRRMFVAPITRFFNEDMSHSRTDYRGASCRVVGFSHIRMRYLGSTLRSRSKRASEC